MILDEILGLMVSIHYRSISCDTEPMDGCEPNNGDAATGDAGTLLQPFSRRATDVSDADLGVIDRCLSRWRAMVLEHVERKPDVFIF